MEHKRDTCEWVRKEWEEYVLWETSCGHIDGYVGADGPTKQGFVFCQYCGKPIEPARLVKV